MDQSILEIRYRPDEGDMASVGLRGAVLLPFEDFLPYRRPKTFRGQSNVRGYYWFATTGILMLCESRLELRILQMLDFDPRVVAASAQPFELAYYSDGKTKRHVPDFFARLSSGAGMVFDVKPSRYAENPKVKRTFDATRAACEEVGWDYQVASEPDPVFISNVRWLAGFRKAPASLERFRESLLKAARDGVLVGDLLRGYDHEALVRPVLFHLLWTGALSADLSIVLSDGSVVRAVEKRGHNV